MVCSASLRVLFVLLALAPALAAAGPDEFAARRAELARRIGPDGMLILMSPPPAQRNGDVDWPFRQEDSLLYLTGQNEPETSLVLVPGESEHKELIFVRDGNPSQEVWTGRIPSRDQVSKETGIRQVVSSTRFRGFLQAAMEGRSWGESRQFRTFGPTGLVAWRDRVRSGKAVVWMIMETRDLGGEPSAELKLVEELRRSYPELQFRDAWPLLSSMRMIKDESEIASVQRAIDVTIEAQKAAMQRVKTARNEYEIQATVEYTFRNLGACCWAFPSIAASGRNTTTLHYETNNDPITAGGLMLTDIGAEVDGYSADVTRTYPQDGSFSPEQKAIYEAVLRTQSETIPMMKAGVYMGEVHEAAVKILGEELLRLGLISSNEREQVVMYFLHGLGHQLGLRTHDVSDRGRKLEAGMIVTNEPGLYVRPTDVRANAAYLKLTAEQRAGIDAALEKYADIGVRIEDDILITDGAPKNLSAAAPRTVAEIEAFMRTGTR
ncbi:MAG: aminopeptidase P N-terminal domain-containing protein [Arenimonas sp.]|nr:aminopeptidase P N-terminal domain-containing protein [Arenimonas sp.]